MPHGFLLTVSSLLLLAALAYTEPTYEIPHPAISSAAISQGKGEHKQRIGVFNTITSRPRSDPLSNSLNFITLASHTQMPRTFLRAPKAGLNLMSTYAEVHSHLLMLLDIRFVRILSSSCPCRIPGSPGGVGRAGGLYQQDMAKQLFHQRSRTPGSHALPVHEPRDEVQVHLDISLESLSLPAGCKICAMCAQQSCCTSQQILSSVWDRLECGIVVAALASADIAS